MIWRTRRPENGADQDVGVENQLAADTREQVADLNQAIRERLITGGQVDDSRVVVTDGGERIGVGDDRPYKDMRRIAH